MSLDGVDKSCKNWAPEDIYNAETWQTKRYGTFLIYNKLLTFCTVTVLLNGIIGMHRTECCYFWVGGTQIDSLQRGIVIKRCQLSTVQISK